VITPDLASEFKDKLQTPMEALHWGIIAAISVGAAMVVLALAVVVIRKIIAMRVSVGRF